MQVLGCTFVPLRLIARDDNVRLLLSSCNSLLTSIPLLSFLPTTSSQACLRSVSIVVHMSRVSAVWRLASMSEVLSVGFGFPHTQHLCDTRAHRCVWWTGRGSQ